jgi:hypothetical protein
MENHPQPPSPEQAARFSFAIKSRVVGGWLQIMIFLFAAGYCASQSSVPLFWLSVTWIVGWQLGEHFSRLSTETREVTDILDDIAKGEVTFE